MFNVDDNGVGLTAAAAYPRTGRSTDALADCIRKSLLPDHQPSAFPSPVHLLRFPSKSSCSLPGTLSPRPSAAPSLRRPARYALPAPQLRSWSTAFAHRIPQWLPLRRRTNTANCSPPRSPSSVPPVALASRSRSSSSSTPALASSRSTTSVSPPVRHCLLYTHATLSNGSAGVAADIGHINTKSEVRRPS